MRYCIMDKRKIMQLLYSLGPLPPSPQKVDKIVVNIWNTTEFHRNSRLICEQAKLTDFKVNCLNITLDCDRDKNESRFVIYSRRSSRRRVYLTWRFAVVRKSRDQQSLGVDHDYVFRRNSMYPGKPVDFLRFRIVQIVRNFHIAKVHLYNRTHGGKHWISFKYQYIQVLYNTISEMSYMTRFIYCVTRYPIYGIRHDLFICN